MVKVGIVSGRHFTPVWLEREGDVTELMRHGVAIVRLGSGNVKMGDNGTAGAKHKQAKQVKRVKRSKAKASKPAFTSPKCPTCGKPGARRTKNYCPTHWAMLRAEQQPSGKGAPAGEASAAAQTP